MEQQSISAKPCPTVWLCLFELSSGALPSRGDPDHAALRSGVVNLGSFTVTDLRATDSAGDVAPAGILQDQDRHPLPDNETYCSVAALPSTAWAGRNTAGETRKYEASCVICVRVSFRFPDSTSEMRDSRMAVARATSACVVSF